MTTPVCPACRAGIAIDAHACPRCGLAVRPTCSNCGEALEVRMHACPRCWEVIEYPSMAAEAPGQYGPQSEGSVVMAQGREQTAQMVAVAPAPAVPQLPPLPPRERRRLRPGRVVLMGLVAGLLVAGGLLVLDALGPQLRGTLPEQVKLVREAFPDLDFAIGVPKGWDARSDTIDSRPGAVFSEPPADGNDVRLRRFDVVTVKRSFLRARTLASERAPASARSYDEIDITDGLCLDGRKAFRHRYGDGDEYREEWWVEIDDKTTYRIQFTSPMSRREESAILFVRIARSFDVL